MELINKLNDLAWGPWMLILLVGTGIYLSYRVGFIQIRKFTYVMKNTMGKMFDKTELKDGEISPFQAVTTALAATVGTGNIAGVTGAIVVGGPGAVFWMWVSAFFGMITKYSEVVLAVKYREKNEKGEWVGGPMYYIKNGLGSKFNWLAILFCLLGSVAAFGIGNMTQVNTIANSIDNAFTSLGFTSMSFVLLGQNVSMVKVVVGIIVSLLIGLVLFGGIQRIGAFAEKLVPIMAFVYVMLSLVFLFTHYYVIDDAFMMIFKGAFNARAAIGGGVGIAIMTTIQKGVGRGVFSNEAGLGSAPMAHASTSETNPIKQGLYGIFEVFMDTIIICTMTALTLLCGYLCGVEVTWGVDAGTELIANSYSLMFGGQFGSLILAVCISLFAFSTILSWALYGSRCCEYLLGTKSIKYYQVLFMIVIVFGACLKLDVVWKIADTLNGFMAIPNLIALLALSPIVIRMTKEYFVE